MMRGGYEAYRAAFDAEPPWWCSRLRLYLRSQAFRGVDIGGL